MTPQLKFAAIDIGSNAVRLLLASVFEFDDGPLFKKMSLTRMPIRLGAEAFALRRISEERVRQLVSAMTGFRHLIDAYRPIAFKACATSAMRGAENGLEICRRIHHACGIDVDIVEGQREAQIIFENKSAERFGGYSAYLYVDVGGGSTEITLFSEDQVQAARSFEIGTVRLLQGGVAPNAWSEMRQWLQERIAPQLDIAAIGSGGNINKLFRLAEVKNGRPLTQAKILKVRRLLERLSFEQRIRQLNLRPDRADVIVPAADIYLNVIEWSGIDAIFVPVVGLADGIVRILYGRYKAETLSAIRSHDLWEISAPQTIPT
jgi:exopolyphosphatase/guanosine-5'-triphosphate,3'-diphosphate pyrophosphatase